MKNKGLLLLQKNTKKVGFIALIVLLSAFTYDYLVSSTAEGTATTTGAWSDVVSTTLVVTNVSRVLVLASIDMENIGGADYDTEAHYQLDYNSSVQSGELVRQLEKGTSDHGMGSLVHIFDVSGETGSVTFKLQHYNALNNANRNVTSHAVLTAVALTTNGSNITLNNQQTTLSSDVGTESSVFEGVAGLSTAVMALPLDGEIYVSASISANASGAGPTGEWELQSSPDNSVWTSMGQPIQRSMGTKFDEGIISLVALAQNFTAGNYYFRVAHKRAIGTTQTVYTMSGSTIVAVALNYNDGIDDCYFPALYDENVTGDANSQVNTYETSASASITTPTDIGSEEPDVFIHAQFGMLGSDALVSTYQFASGVWNGVEQARDVSSSTDRGSGVLIGLAENLDGNTTVPGILQHKTTANTLTTSCIVLTGFQLFNVADPVPVPVELTSFSANVNNISVILNWQTATEVNNYGFSIERKSGIENREWEVIGFVEGHGNCNSPKNYSFVDNTPINGQIQYRLKQIDTDGGFEYSDVQIVDVNTSREFKLSQNHPNPFNPTTKISFSIPQSARVAITVYNSLGQEITELVNRDFAAGNHSVDFDGSNFSSGMYFYTLKSADFSETIKMMLVK